MIGIDRQPKLCLDLNYKNGFTYGKSPHLEVYW